MKYDFGGYATKTGVRCRDGRIIQRGAFDAQDGMKVPMVYQHLHDSLDNVLGHAILEVRDDGVYAYATFNDTPQGKSAKECVRHGDLNALSIYANDLVQRGSVVTHGTIRELSLVLAGANPEATIDNISFQHGGMSEISEEEAIISFNIDFTKDDMEHADEDDTSEMPDPKKVLETMNEDQKALLFGMVATALNQNENAADDVSHSDKADEKGAVIVKKNIFDRSAKVEENSRSHLSHSQIKTILEDGVKMGSLKESFMTHAQEYGIENIDILFPDAKTVTPTPDFIKRRTEWVTEVVDGATHSPFSRVKSTAADITADEARAKGYVKGNLKKEEVIKLLKRTTTPTTVYKKQKLDRDDIVDITDLDVVAWLKSEMQLMLKEEIGRAVLVSDGREADDADKINEEHIRPIYKEPEMYAYHVILEVDNTPEQDVDAFVEGMEDYEGRGEPTAFMASKKVTKLLLQRDKLGRRLYNTEAELAAAMGVNRIVRVPVMNDVTRVDDTAGEVELLGIVLNMKDYVIGADKGGETTFFENFDIDYNQYKYLYETRISGSLVHPKSAVIVERKKA